MIVHIVFSSPLLTHKHDESEDIPQLFLLSDNTPFCT